MERGLTIFTPTYNRAYCLPALYHSLCAQTDSAFEWLVVDDGSTDDTRNLIECWKQEGRIRIRYFWQENAGKAQAHNRGGELARMELFVCVDSDDVLKPNAVADILSLWRQHSDQIGMIFLKERLDGRPMAYWDNKTQYCTLYDAYRKYGLRGEAMLVYRTALIRKYKFPTFEGEKFIQESYLYDRLDQEGTLYITDKSLYRAEYLEDGYTRNSNKIFRENPHGYQAYIVQRLKLDKKLKYKILDTILYIGSKRLLKDHRMIEDSVFPVLTCFLYLPSVFYYSIKDAALRLKNEKRG